MDNREYIIKHRHEDVRRLALGRAEQGVDMPFCLRQIEAWQKACTKLPRWAETDDILFPPRINMEQCSSQATAEYKRDLILRLLPEHRSSMADLTVVLVWTSVSCRHCLIKPFMWSVMPTSVR